jgi:hypothetical protein
MHDRTTRGEKIGEMASAPCIECLVTSALLAFCEVHVHRGNFTLGLKVTENIELNQQVSLGLP